MDCRQSPNGLHLQYCESHPIQGASGVRLAGGIDVDRSSIPAESRRYCPKLHDRNGAGVLLVVAETQADTASNDARFIANDIPLSDLNADR